MLRSILLHVSAHAGRLRRAVLLGLIASFPWNPAMAQEAAGEGAAEPWIIEGESLQGTGRAGSEILMPRVRHGILEITAKMAWLSPDRDLLTFRDQVHIADTTRVTTSDQAVYRRSTRVLTLSGSVRGNGPEGDFEAGDATWDRAGDHLTLRDHPQVFEPDRKVWADRFEVDNGGRTGEAYGNVRILLLPDSTRAFGERAAYDQLTGLTRLTGAPRLLSPAGKDEPATDVHADTLLLDQARRVGQARSKVRILRGSLRARSERAFFYLKDNRILLFGDPVTWDQDGEIRADTMSVRVHQREADQLRAFGHVRVHFEPRDKPGEQNLVLGDTLVAGLRMGAVTDMEIRGSAVSLYLPSLADAATGTGRNLCRGRTIHVYLQRGQADRVDLIRSASGTYLYPGDADRKVLANPGLADSLLPADLGAKVAASGDSSGVLRGLPRDSAGPPEIEPPAEPPPVSPALEAYLKSPTLTVPDSLRSRYDRLFSEKVDYEGDTIRFFVPEDRIQLLGKGKLRYQGNELESREIIYRADRNLITAMGEPTLGDAQDKVTGAKMTYRTDERAGIIYQGRTIMDNARYFGEEIKKLPSDALLVRQGDYTTCDRDSSADYHFHAQRMKMIMHDKVVARPVILYIKHVPVLALPYYVFPIKKGRRSGIMMPDVEFGLSKNKGRFVKNMGYYWAISDYMDARSWINYYDSGPQIDFNGIYNYSVRYLLNGSLDGSYSKISQSGGGRRIGWSLRTDHRQTLGEGADLTMQGNFTSDKTYRGQQDFTASVDDRLNRTLASSAALSKRWSGASLSVTANHTQYLDETTAGGVRITRVAPSVNLSLNALTLGRAPDARGRGGRLALLSGTTVGTSMSYRNVYTQRYGGTISANQAVQQTMSLHDSRAFGSLLQIGTGFSGNWAAFGRNNQGRRWRGGAAWSASASAGNTLYGTFLFPVRPLLGVRHVVQSSVSYGYSPELNSLTYPDSAGHRVARFPNVGGIGLGGSKSSAATFSLDQRWHVKWSRNGHVVTKESLFSWNTSASYDFLAKKVPGEARARSVSTISNSFRLRPFANFESGAGVSHDPYTRAPQGFNLNTSLSLTGDLFKASASDTSKTRTAIDYGDFGDANTMGSSRGQARRGTQGATTQPWALSLTHSYATQRGASHPSNSLNSRLSLHPTEHWKFEVSVYMDLYKRQVIQHSLTMYRDLHCWELRFEHHASGASADWVFYLGIKQISDVHYERRSR